MNEWRLWMESGAWGPSPPATSGCCAVVLPIGNPSGMERVGMKEGSCRWGVSTQEWGERSVCFPGLQIPLDGRKQSHILWDHPWGLGWGIALSVPGLWGTLSTGLILLRGSSDTQPIPTHSSNRSKAT